jgi:hypothetical protein
MTSDEEKEAEKVRDTALLIANTLTNSEVEFGVALMALTMVLVKAAMDCEIDKYELIESLDSSVKLLYDNFEEEDKLTGGDYVQ